MPLFDWITDEELEEEVNKLAARAHDAKATSYAARARDWEVAHDELERRRMIRESMVT